MNRIKDYLQSLRQHPPPDTQVLEQELKALREAQANASAALEKAQQDLQRAHAADAQSLARLQQQLGELDSDHAHAREQIVQLEHSLATAEQRRNSTEGRVDLLETRLREETDSTRERAVQAQGLLTDTAQQQKSLEGRLDTLETRLGEQAGSAREQAAHIQSLLGESEQHRASTEARVDALQNRLRDERHNTQERVAHLQSLLAETEQRQKAAEAHVASLESRFDEASSRYEASLARLQEEAQSLLARHSELTRSHEVVITRLQELQKEVVDKPRQSRLMSAAFAAMLLVAGALAGVFIMQGQQDRSRELAVLEQDIRDMRAFLKARVDSQDAALNDLALALERQPGDAQAPVVVVPPEQATATQEADQPPPGSGTYTPDIRELQAALITLGYDLGIPAPNGEAGVKTRQALQEFRQFYLTERAAEDELTSEPLAALVLKSADMARADAARFAIRRDVLAAIRLASRRTGVDFSFLMELAGAESDFDPAARAPRSSATGLFQFRDHTWLEVIRTFGGRYGLADHAAGLEPAGNGDHGQTPIVRDPLQLEVLALRLNPRLSSLMMAESIRRNLQMLSDRTGREPGRTELYLAHFLGPDGALTFLEKLVEAPDTIAAELFPQQAGDYPGVFQIHRQQPRTVGEIYQRFESKFNTGRYGERVAG